MYNNSRAIQPIVYVGLANVRMRKDCAATTGTLTLNFTLPGPSSFQVLSSLVLLVYLPIFNPPSHLLMLALASSGVKVPSSSGLSHSSSDAPTPDQLLVQQHGDVSERRRWENQLSHVKLTHAKFVEGQ